MYKMARCTQGELCFGLGIFVSLCLSQYKALSYTHLINHGREKSTGSHTVDRTCDRFCLGENESSKQVYIVVKIDFISCQNFNFYCKGIYSEQYKPILVCSDPCNEFNTIYFSWLNSSCCLTNKYTYLIEIHYESSNAKSIIH